MRMWCQIFLLLMIRLNLFTILCYCPASTASFTFLSADSFLQVGKRCRSEVNIARSSINFMCCPQERGCRENGSLSTSLCFSCMLFGHKASKLPGRSSRPSSAATGASVLLFVSFCLKAERAP